MAGYVSPTAVYARDAGRAFNQTSAPTASQVAQFIDHIAGEIDGILSRRGYGLPVPTTATAGLSALAHYNALGALALIEISAPSHGGKRDIAVAMWNDARRMLADGTIEFPDVPIDLPNASPRGKSSMPATAMFYLGMEH